MHAFFCHLLIFFFKITVFLKKFFQEYHQSVKQFGSILTGKRNPIVKFCHVLHVAHKHELQKLTMTKILSKASELF